VGDRRDRDEDGAHAALGETGDRARNGGAGVGVYRRVAMGVAGASQADPDEGLARAGQRVTECPHDGQVGGHRVGEIPGAHSLVVEGEVDDRVSAGRGLAQSVQVAQIAAAHPGAHGLYGSGRRLGPNEAGDLVSGLDQLGDDRRADVTTGAGDEDMHEQLSKG
jgi:hypothetical protein